jgi:hypothetical protein
MQAGSGPFNDPVKVTMSIADPAAIKQIQTHLQHPSSPATPRLRPFAHGRQRVEKQRQVYFFDSN